jgi:hypothetical protein
MSSDGTQEPASLSTPDTPRIHEATCVTGGVERGAEITEAEAVQHRRSGRDIVVCGDDTHKNCLLAQRIEQQATGGRCKHEGPHEEAGLNALPHWQPNPRPPAGHSFYETHDPRRKSR